MPPLPPSSRKGLPFGALDVVAGRGSGVRAPGGIGVLPTGIAPGPVKPPLTAVANIPAPEIYPWPGAQDFAAEGFQTGINLASGEVTLATLVVPTQNVAVVRDLTVIVNTMLATTDARFRFRINDGVVQGYDYRPFPRPAASLEASFPPESTLIRIPEGATITYTAVILDAGTYDIGAYFHGWFWSKVTNDRFAQQWPT